MDLRLTLFGRKIQKEGFQFFSAFNTMVVIKINTLERKISQRRWWLVLKRHICIDFCKLHAYSIFLIMVKFISIITQHFQMPKLRLCNQGDQVQFNPIGTVQLNLHKIFIVVNTFCHRMLPETSDHLFNISGVVYSQTVLVYMLDFQFQKRLP